MRSTTRSLLFMLAAAVSSKPYPVVTLYDFGNSTDCKSDTHSATTVPATSNYCHNAVRYLCNTTSHRLNILTYESFPYCHGVPVETEFVIAPQTYRTACQDVGGADHFVYSCGTADAPVVTYETDGDLAFYVSSTCTATFEDSSQKYTCCGENQIAVQTYEGDPNCEGPSSVIIKQDADSSSGWTLSCSPSSDSACPKARTAEEDEGYRDHTSKAAKSGDTANREKVLTKLNEKTVDAKTNVQGVRVAQKVHKVLPKPLMYLCVTILCLGVVAAIVLCVSWIRRNKHTALVVDRDSYRYHAVGTKPDVTSP